MKSNPFGSNGEIYVLIQFILLFLVVFVSPSILPTSSNWILGVWVSVGALLVVSGLVFLLFGMIHLGRNLRAMPKPKESAELVTNGIYRLVRHPIYAGLLCCSFGLAFYRANEMTLLWSLLLLVLLHFKVNKEEEWLQDKFPTYEVYSKKVARFFPFIY